MLSKSEHIRRVLNKTFDMPAAEVAGRLQNKGIEIDPGLVHVVRSSMRKERQEAENERLAEAKAAETKRLAEIAKRQQEQEAQKAKLRAMAAKVQETKALNPLPLRQHIMDAFTGHEGLTISDVIVRCEKTYKFDDKEKFKQNVRKRLRLMVLSGDLASKEGNKFGLSTAVIQGKPFDQKVLEPSEAENGIAFLVSKLKVIVAKVGKKETKELIDVL